MKAYHQEIQISDKKPTSKASLIGLSILLPITAEKGTEPIAKIQLASR